MKNLFIVFLFSFFVLGCEKENQNMTVEYTVEKETDGSILSESCFINGLEQDPVSICYDYLEP
jgi:uncharacterized protein YcfL